jgi:hypothetical protein
LVFAAFCLVGVAFARSSNEDALATSTRILVVTTSDWNAAKGALQRYERLRPDNRWKTGGGAVTTVVGKNGMGWSVGVRQIDDPTLRGPEDPVRIQ